MTESKQGSSQNLSPELIEKIKLDLLAEKEQIIKDLDEFENTTEGSNHIVKFPEYGEKPDENAQEIGDYSANLVKDKVLNSSLKDIEGALKRIEDGSYGICKYCGEPISEKRLLARPVASACIPCKTKLQNAA